MAADTCTDGRVQSSLSIFCSSWQLAKYLPKGLPVFEDAFLWIDNYRWEYLM